MAIKIAGTTVIDDSRNVCNICTVTATTVCGSHVGSGAGLTGVEAPPTYICNIACAAISNGDPVTAYSTCGVCGILSSPSTCWSGYNFCYGPYGVSSTNDAVTVKFLCSDNCFAVIRFVSPVFTGSGTYMGQYSCPGCMRIQAFCVSPGGILSSPTDILHCCYSACFAAINCCASSDSCITYAHMRKMIPIPSCSGTQAAVLLCTCRYANGSGQTCVCCAQKQEIKLCFCTTNSQISLISYNCGSVENSTNYSFCQFQHYITPDRCYFASVILCTCVYSRTPASGDIQIDIKTMTDSTCYLSYSQASIVSGCPLYCMQCTTCNGVMDSDFAGNIRLPAIHPFAHGADGWSILYLNVYCNCANPYCTQYAQAAMAWKPTGNGQITTSANVIRSSCTWCMPFFYCNASCGANGFNTGGYKALVRTIDQGDGIKKLYFSMSGADSGSGPCSGICMSCWKICTGNLLCPTGNSWTGQCLQSAGYCALGMCAFGEMNSSSGGLNTGYAGELYKASWPLCASLACYASFVCCGPAITLSRFDQGWNKNFNGGCVCGFSYRLCTQDVPITWANQCWIGWAFSSGWSAQRGSDYACKCPSTYNPYPAPFHNCSIFVTAGNGHFQPIAVGIANCPAVNIITVFRNDANNTTREFYGIAQNDASVGQIVCVATPGMLDTSCMMSRFFPTCTPCRITIGTCCNGGPATAETDVLLGQGFGTSGFCIYFPGNIQYQGRYDAKYGRIIAQSNRITCY